MSQRIVVIRTHSHEHIRLFWFGSGIVAGAHEQRQLICTQVIQDLCLPPQASSSDTDCPNGVTNVVLTVAIGSLTVLPGLSPEPYRDLRRLDSLNQATLACS